MTGLRKGILPLAAALACGAAPASGQVVLSDVDLSPYCGAPVVVDLVVPEEPAIPGVPPPMVLFVHGGGWAVGDKGSFSKMQKDFSPYFVTASVNYRLTSRPYPDDGTADYSQVGGTVADAAKDVDCAVRWMKDLSELFPWAVGRKIGIAGHSAGGHLTMLQATRQGKGRVDAASSWAGPSDILNDRFIKSLIPRADWGDKSVNPADQIHAGMPPTLVWQAVNDLIVAPSHARKFCRVSAGAGNWCKPVYTLGGHGFDGLLDAVEGWTFYFFGTTLYLGKPG